MGYTYHLYYRDTPTNSGQPSQHKRVVLQMSGLAHIHGVCDGFSGGQVGAFLPRYSRGNSDAQDGDQLPRS